MKTIKETFNKSKVLLPVIHVESYDQAFFNVNLAYNADADGVWLINHGSLDAMKLMDIKNRIKQDFSDFWIGLNCLDITSAAAFGFMRDFDYIADGYWTDNAAIDELHPDKQTYAELTNNRREGLDALYFGGVAFKYQRPVKNVELAVEIATRYVDVITTSGEGTGYAADIGKIQRMFNAAEGHDLAIASGITVENVHEYTPYINGFLVSTGISKDFHNLDYERTKELALRIHSQSL